MNTILNGLMGNMMNNNPVGKVIGAMMSGKDLNSTIIEVAQSNPNLAGLNINNLQQTAQQMCNAQGIDMNTAIQNIKSQFHI